MSLKKDYYNELTNNYKNENYSFLVNKFYLRLINSKVCLTHSEIF
ncbi:hypothetical protein C7448_11355 [Tenacibaculum gallaicum]|uniref:Uncharacterized protein n=1 Tax=Tenacibaculum gallaicum TaxID=561505 RepID=A0A3E0HE66_9FLAO|nr:hypothetical protein C7448_11355 [Tenacibaculum gallaicum]